MAHNVKWKTLTTSSEPATADKNPANGFGNIFIALIKWTLKLTLKQCGRSNVLDCFGNLPDLEAFSALANQPSQEGVTAIAIKNTRPS